jgi:hypothetical protein
MSVAHSRATQAWDDVKTLSRFRTSALCSALACGAARALADDAPEPIALEYQAPAGCPSRLEFIALVEGYTQKVQWVAADQAKRRFSVMVAARAGEVSGTLTIDTEGERSVTARSCAEIVDALALATALAIDPGEMSPPPKVEPEPKPKPKRRPLAPTPQPEAARPPGSVGATGYLLFAVAPEIVAGASFDISWRWHVMPVADSSLQFSFGYLDSGWPERATTVQLGWLPWARLRGCPVHLSLAGPLEVAPCIGSQLGRLRSVAGEQITEPFPPASRTWIAIDGGVELELRLDAFGLYLMGGGVLPLRRLRYLVATPSGRDAVVHDLSIKPSVFVGLGARIALFGSPD